MYWKLLKESLPITKSHNISTDTFSCYFKAINNPDSHFFQADEDALYYNERYLRGEIQIMFDELNVEITYLEIIKAVKQLKCNSASGPDMFLNDFLSMVLIS